MLDPPSLADSFDSTSRSLVERARARDPQAWARLVQFYSPLVHFWLRTARLRAEDAADLLQDVFRSVAGAIGRFEHDAPQASFRGWLRTITLRVGNRRVGVRAANLASFLAGDDRRSLASRRGCRFESLDQRGLQGQEPGSDTFARRTGRAALDHKY
jgi:hypothetical protein